MTRITRRWRGKTPPEQAGFNGDQQFFLAYGQTRANKPREGSLRQQVMTDPHAPSDTGRNTVRNIDAWYPAFQVKGRREAVFVPGGTGEDLVGMAEADEYMEESRFNARECVPTLESRLFYRVANKCLGNASWGALIK